MLKAFIVYYRYQGPSDKALGPVRQFRIYASDAEQARRLASQYGNYPNIEILRIRPA